MKYDFTTWIHGVSQAHHGIAGESRMILADAQENNSLDDGEVAIIQQWIRDAERIRDEAYTMLINWTRLPDNNRNISASSEAGEAGEAGEP